MNNPIRMTNSLLAAAVATALLAGCSMSTTRPDGAIAVREKLTRLQNDPQLASRAPVAIQDAELAVATAEVAQRDPEFSKHLIFIADRKVDIASARAQTRLLEDQRKLLGEATQSARLASRTREADLAHSDAAAARSDAADAREEADAARDDADAARLDSQALQAELAALNARATERGMVIALGDVLFESGRSGLKAGAAHNLDQLAAFLVNHQERSVIIEGHTDSVGSEESNQLLSQRRADAVKAYLMSEGVLGTRLVSSGMGEGVPVADNTSASGRQQNRRVEVIIANPVLSSR